MKLLALFCGLLVAINLAEDRLNIAPDEDTNGHSHDSADEFDRSIAPFKRVKRQPPGDGKIEPCIACGKDRKRSIFFCCACQSMRAKLKKLTNSVTPNEELKNAVRNSVNNKPCSVHTKCCYKKSVCMICRANLMSKALEQYRSKWSTLPPMLEEYENTLRNFFENLNDPEFSWVKDSNDREFSWVKDRYAAGLKKKMKDSDSLDFGDSGSLDFGDSGSMDFGDSGSLDFGDSGSLDFGDSGSLDFGASGFSNVG